MKQSHTTQHSIFDFYPEHELGKELKFISDWLDENPDLIDWVQRDLSNVCKNNAGRNSLTAESVLRCAILKQTKNLTYEDLEFSLMDSLSCQTFGRFDLSKPLPKKSALQSNIARISDVTWEVISQQLLKEAKIQKIEKGDVIRIDSTVTDTDIHEPTDSWLLWDSVRTMVRLMDKAMTLTESAIPWVNHRRGAKNKMHEIFNTKGIAKKVPLYESLLKYTYNSLKYIETAEQILKESGTDIIAYDSWLTQKNHFIPLILKVVDQTQRRIFNEESVTATEKIFSLFEEHTDIIKKGGREIKYGHKLNLSSGKSGLILDMVIESGNPNDTERFLPMLERHKDNYGEAPRQCSVDGGYASIENLEQAKLFCLKDAVFSKKKGLIVEDMAKSKWVYHQLKNFRAGIESNISCLKRAYGLTRCTWKGWERFNQYIWSSVVAYNLTLFARLSLKKA
jgi:IS5 family transposase